MLWTIAAILLVLWVLVIAIIVGLVQLFTGRRAV